MKILNIKYPYIEIKMYSNDKNTNLYNKDCAYHWSQSATTHSSAERDMTCFSGSM